MATHAYIMSPYLMKWSEDNAHHMQDGFIRRTFGSKYDGIDGAVRSQGNQYAQYPMVCYQRGSPSSITNGDFYEFFLSDPRYMKFNEWLTCEAYPYITAFVGGAIVRGIFATIADCECES